MFSYGASGGVDKANKAREVKIQAEQLLEKCNKPGVTDAEKQQILAEKAELQEKLKYIKKR